MCQRSEVKVRKASSSSRWRENQARDRQYDIQPNFPSPFSIFHFEISLGTSSITRIDFHFPPRNLNIQTVPAATI